MEDLKIYVDRLRREKDVKINTALSPDFLQIKEDELYFKDPVLIEVTAYLAEDHLVIRFSIRTTARLPCSICNEEVSYPIDINDYCATYPLSEIKHGLVDLTEEIREAILLQTPLFIECAEGKCPEREHIKAFLKTEDTSPPPSSHNFPFSEL